MKSTKCKLSNRVWTLCRGVKKIRSCLWTILSLSRLSALSLLKVKSEPSIMNCMIHSKTDIFKFDSIFDVSHFTLNTSTLLSKMSIRWQVKYYVDSNSIVNSGMSRVLKIKSWKHYWTIICEQKQFFMRGKTIHRFSWFRNRGGKCSLLPSS